MIIDKSQVKRILIITLSNVGDIILTTPVIRTLAVEFPDARIDVMAGPKGKDMFSHDPRIFKFIAYDKHMPVSEKRRLQLKLKKLKYDLVVDLRNTVFPLLIGPKFRTATIQRFPKHVIHSTEKHLCRIKTLGIKNLEKKSYLHITKEDEEYIEKLLKESGIADPVVVVNPGAKSHLKRWDPAFFADVCDALVRECKVNIVFTGVAEDEEIVKNVIKNMKNVSYSLVNKTNIRQLGGLLKRARLLVTNDSAPLHLSCAVGTKVLAIFGPTDPRKYGPTGEFDVVINKKLSCSPCESSTCKYNYECMKLISPGDVFDAARIMVEGYE